MATDTTLKQLIINDYTSETAVIPETLPEDQLALTPDKSLETVAHDTTLSGSGTTEDPLKVADDTFLPLSGGTLTGALVFRSAASSPGILLFSQYNLTNGGVISGSPGELALGTTNDPSAIRIGSTGIYPFGAKASGASFAKWTNVYTTTINNGADITVPTTGGTMALLSDVDRAATSGTLVKSCWFGKTKASTTVPTPTLPGQNYYDFTTGQIYKSADGTTWTLDSTYTPPTDVDVQIGITSKFWDIAEQENQHGGVAKWSHTDSDWAYYPEMYESKPAGGASLKLLTRLISDFKFNDVSYLNANTYSWQSGSVYTAVYQHLVEDMSSTPYITTAMTIGKCYRSSDNDQTVDDVTYYAWVDNINAVIYTVTSKPVKGDDIYNGNPPSMLPVYKVTDSSWAVETIGNISVLFFKADDGHRICAADQETAVSQFYAETGEANFYILDTANARFKLPRTQKRKLIRAVKNTDGSWYNLYSDGYVEQGIRGLAFTTSVKTATLPIEMKDINYDVWVGKTNANDNYILAYPASANTVSYKTTSGSTQNNNIIVSGYAEASAIANEPIQYEYYYVGNFEQSAIEQTAGINAEMFNDKADTSMQNVTADGKNEVVGWMFPDWDNVIDWNPTSNYVVPSDGYLFLKGNGISYDLYKSDQTTLIIAEFALSANYTSIMQPVTKGQYLKFRTGSAQYSIMKFIPCKKA